MSKLVELEKQMEVIKKHWDELIRKQEELEWLSFTSCGAEAIEKQLKELATEKKATMDRKNKLHHMIEAEKMQYRVMVKMDGMSRYQAVAENDTGVALAPNNKIYHSYFTLAAAEALIDELRANGIEDCKITK